MAQLELKQLTYYYPKKSGSSDGSRGAVINANLQLESGEFASLQGPSGSGKSTLLRLIAGFLQPKIGEIRLRGKCIASPEVMIPPHKRRIGMVFQQHALFPHLKVRDNILYGCPKSTKEEQRQVLENLLSRFHIGKHRESYPHQLSGGEQQRVAIARALAAEPELLLLDEPFNSLDPSLRQEIRQECAAVLRERGVTALIVTHDEEDAQMLTVTRRFTMNEIQKSLLPHQP
jgi:iron(III) transport system ATP-binding protein